MANGANSEAGSSAKSGRKIALSAPRKMMCDVLAAAKKVPTVPVQRRMNVAAVAAARSRLGSAAPGWFVLFTKAYAITAQRIPQLRRSYQPFPRAHLYEHPCSIVSAAVEREYEGEHVVLWAQVKQPDALSLAELQQRLRQFKDAPIESIRSFRKMLTLGRMPGVVRRVAWWLALNFSGYQRARNMGTFGVSVYSRLGAESLHPIAPLSTLLNYGPISESGEVNVRIVYDHRVTDGATIARALGCLEEVLNQEIVAELEAAGNSLAA